MLSCQRAPSWLAEAPLIGARVQDDAGRQTYLVRAPARVALATPYALPLWEEAGLLDKVVAACVGAGEGARVFFLPCEDSLALTEAVFKARTEWVWVSHPQALAQGLSTPVYVFAPKRIEDWLRHLRLLGQVYDRPSLVRLADSLEGGVQNLSAQARQARQLKVIALTAGEPFRALDSNHPLATLIREAGGKLVSLDSISASPPDVIVVPAQAPTLVNDLLAFRPELYESPAIRYRRLYSVEPWLLEAPFSRPVRGFYTLLQILHPELAPSTSESAQKVEDKRQE